MTSPASFTGRLLLALLLLVVAAGHAISQKTWYRSNCPASMKEAGLWYFGEKCGIDFRSGMAAPLTDENVMTAFKASSAICDSLGNFMLFTDGRRAWDRNFNLMPNATGLDGDLGSTQPCIIVPWPGDSLRYFIITTDILKFTDSVTYTTRGLKATAINMNYRGGLGDAISGYLNYSLHTPVCQKLTAVKHGNNRHYWVIAHEWDSDRFLAWPVTESGIGDPVISATGSVHGGHRTDVNNSLGYMKTSPDGSHIALAVSQKKLIELFDFDNTTGVISNPRSYTTTKSGVNPYGIEFSPDGSKLYATVFETGGVAQVTVPSYIFQFDLAMNGLNNPVIVDSIAGMRIAAMQLAADGRIYISRTNNILSKRDSLEVIYNPNRPGTACNLSRLNNVPFSGFPLAGRKSIYSLPNIVQSFVDVPSFTWDSVCHGDVTIFHITNTSNIDSVLWDFGDGSISNLFQPAHAFANPGNYKVRLTEMFNGEQFTDSMTVTSWALPQINLGDTVLLYKGSSINLHAGGGYMEYLWSTASQDSIIPVGEQGDYWARVKDLHCCTNADTTYIKVFEYFIPNAFSPNGDGLNDWFRVNGLYRNIEFSMHVFDRWGTEVFRSDNIDDGWNGMVNGKYCPSDSYVWIVRIKFLGQDIITQGDISFKGTVTIVR